MGFPLVYLGWMSLQRWSLIGDEAPHFVGLQNFLQLAADERFVDALGRTFWFTLLGLVSNLPLGLGIALLMHERFWGRNLSRALDTPMVATPAAMGLVWVIMLDPTLGRRALPARWGRHRATAVVALRSGPGGADAGSGRCLDVDADGGPDLHRRACGASHRTIRGRRRRRRLRDPAVPPPDAPADAAHSDGGGNAEADGAPEADRHRLRHDRRRPRPLFGNDEPLQLSGRPFLRQDRLWLGDRAGFVRHRHGLHADADLGCEGLQHEPASTPAASPWPLPVGR